jgi:hypothetical protein
VSGRDREDRHSKFYEFSDNLSGAVRTHIDAGENERAPQGGPDAEADDADSQAPVGDLDKETQAPLTAAVSHVRGSEDPRYPRAGSLHALGEA